MKRRSILGLIATIPGLSFLRSRPHLAQEPAPQREAIDGPPARLYLSMEPGKVYLRAACPVHIQHAGGARPSIHIREGDRLVFIRLDVSQSYAHTYYWMLEGEYGYFIDWQIAPMPIAVSAYVGANTFELSRQTMDSAFDWVGGEEPKLELPGIPDWRKALEDKKYECPYELEEKACEDFDEDSFGWIDGEAR